MPKVRLHPSQITPKYEDAGLFKDEVCQINVELCPIIQRNGRQDLLVTGYTKGSLSICVLFAGRRLTDAAPLVASLKSLRDASLMRARKRGVPAPLNPSLRMPVQIEGAWRKRIITDNDGFAQRSYQLIAARWTVVDQSGQTINFGSPPAL